MPSSTAPVKSGPAPFSARSCEPSTGGGYDSHPNGLVRSGIQTILANHVFPPGLGLRCRWKRSEGYAEKGSIACP
jgi:hypothetical protein